MSTEIQQENLIIIGGGPAGLAAAIYASRASLNPPVFAGSPPGGQLTLTSEVENYPGYDSILGAELIEKMRKQAEKFGTRIINENILGVNFSQSRRSVQISLSCAKKITDVISSAEKSLVDVPAKAVIIATGAKALWLELPSEQKLRGKGVSACATCDGFFFKNKVVAVVGGGDTAMEEALTLTKFATKVYLIHRRNEFRASKVMQDRVFSHPNIEIIGNAQIEEVLGEQKVEGIKLIPVDSSGRPTEQVERRRSLQATESQKIDGLFIAIGHQPDTELFKNKLILDTKGYLMTTQQATYEFGKSASRSRSDQKIDLNPFNLDFSTSTSTNGVFAAGDCVDHVYRQAATAVGMGVAAALDAERWLNEAG